MPVAQGARPPARQALLIGLGALLGLLAIVFLVSRLDRLAQGDGAEIELGNPVFTIGSAEEFAEVIEEEGPLFLPDAAGGDRGVWLHHLGDDDSNGWLAVAIRAPDAEPGCLVEWQGGAREFVDLCDDTAFPETGEGLDQYSVSVNPDGDLIINLNPTG